MCRIIVGARDSVPTLGPNSPLADPGRGGGVTSIGFGGFGDGAADDAVLMAVFGVDFLVETVASTGAGVGVTTGLLLNVKCAGTEALAPDSDCLSTTGAVWGGGEIIVFVIGDGAGRFDVGDGGTE